MTEIEDIIARAWDREEAAQMGEPSPWESEKLCGEPLDKDWVAERIGCAGAVIDALETAGYVICPRSAGEAEFEVTIEDDHWATASGPRDKAFAEALHYAAMGGNTQICEILRLPVKVVPR